MTAGLTVADYLDGIRYRRYSRTVMVERRRLLGLAAVCGGDAWLASAPAEEVVATVQVRLGFHAPTQLQRLRAAVTDYQAWRRRHGAREAAA